MNQLKIILIFIILFILYKLCNKKDVVEGWDNQTGISGYWGNNGVRNPEDGGHISRSWYDWFRYKGHKTIRRESDYYQNTGGKMCMSDTPHHRDGWKWKGSQCYRTQAVSHLEQGPLKTWQLYGGTGTVAKFGGNGYIGNIREHPDESNAAKWHGHSIDDAYSMRLIASADKKNRNKVLQYNPWARKNVAPSGIRVKVPPSRHKGWWTHQQCSDSTATGTMTGLVGRGTDPNIHRSNVHTTAARRAHYSKKPWYRNTYGNSDGGKQPMIWHASNKRSLGWKTIGHMGGRSDLKSKHGNHQNWAAFYYRKSCPDYWNLVANNMKAYGPNPQPNKGYGRNVADRACNRVPGCIMRSQDPPEAYRKAVLAEQNRFINAVKNYSSGKEKYYMDNCKLTKTDSVIEAETGKDTVNRFDHKTCLWMPSGKNGWRGNKYNITQGCRGKIRARRRFYFYNGGIHEGAPLEYCEKNPNASVCEYTYKDGVLPDIPGTKGRSGSRVQKSSDNNTHLYTKAMSDCDYCEIPKIESIRKIAGQEVNWALQDPPKFILRKDWDKEKHKWTLKCKDGYNGNISLDKCPEPKQKPIQPGKEDTNNPNHNEKKMFFRGLYPDGTQSTENNMTKSIIIGGEGKCLPVEQCLKYKDFKDESKVIKGKCEKINNNSDVKCKLTSTGDACANEFDGDCRFTEYPNPLVLRPNKGYIVEEDGTKTYRGSFRVNIKSCAPGYTRKRDESGAPVPLKATVCSGNNTPYYLEGCQMDSCGYRASKETDGRTDAACSVSDEKIGKCKKACLSFKTGDCSVDTDDINDEIVSSSQCSTFVNRCQGKWVDVDDFDKNGCKFRCQQDKDSYKVKKWVVDGNNPSDIEYARTIDPENADELIGCKNYEDEVMIYRKCTEHGPKPCGEIRLTPGMNIYEGDLRLGYNGRWKTKEDLKRVNVTGKLPAESDKDKEIDRMIKCTKADETKCSALNLDNGVTIQAKNGMEYDLVDQNRISQQIVACRGWNEINNIPLEKLSGKPPGIDNPTKAREYPSYFLNLTPPQDSEEKVGTYNRFGRKYNKCVRKKISGGKYINEITDTDQRNCQGGGLSWIDYLDLNDDNQSIKDIMKETNNDNKKTMIIDLIRNSDRFKAGCITEKYNDVTYIPESGEKIPIIPEVCEYNTCSKHCDVKWKPSEIDFEKVQVHINDGGKFYNYEDGNDLQWGSCIRSDGAKCGVGLQAREALINTDSNFGFGDNFGGGKCFIPPSPTPDGDGIDSEGKSTKLSIEHTELSKYEYKKCRGDKGKKWEPCNDKLKSHVSGGGGITNLKNDFRLLGNIMITPKREGFANMKLIEGNVSGPATATPPIPAIPATAIPAIPAIPATAIPAIPAIPATAEVSQQNMNKTFDDFSQENTSDENENIADTRLSTEEIKKKYVDSKKGGCIAYDNYKENFWEKNESRVSNLDAQIEDKEKKISSIVNKINQINQIQIDYVKADSYRNSSGKVITGLKHLVLLKRPEQMFRIFDEISTDIDSNDSTINETMRSIPLGGSIPKVDWLAVFTIRLIYILELLNLKTIQRMNIISDYVKKYPHYLKILTNFYYVKENYTSDQVTGKAYKIGYNDNISEEPKDHNSTPVGKWNLYPIQWMYGGERKTGLNSSKAKEVQDHAIKIIRSFYVPCRDINELHPMEQYIRFNISLYKYIQDNYKLLTSFHSNIISLNRGTIVKDGKACYNDVKKCGFSSENYPKWYIDHIKRCEIDIDKCIIDKDKKYSRPKSMDLEIKKWQCEIGFEGGPSEDECCRLLGDYDIDTGKCNKPFQNIQENISSNLVELGEQSKIFKGKQQNLVLGNIDKTKISDLNQKLQGQMGKDGGGCARYSGSANEKKCDNETNCKYEKSLKRCVYNPIPIQGEKYKLGSASAKKNINIGGKLWNEWIYTLENGNTSTPEDIKKFKSKILENDQWKEGNDWLPGMQPNKNNWETNVKLKDQTETILDFGKTMREEGIKKKYQDDFCKFWEDNADCKKLVKLQNENDVLLDERENLINSNIQLKSFGIDDKDSEETLKLKNGLFINKVKDKEDRINNLTDELTILRKRPRKCENCKPCFICKSCPDEETYKKAKGICPACSCNSSISESSTKEISLCDQKHEKLKSELLKRNTIQFKELTNTNESKIKDLNSLIKSTNEEIYDLETNENICKQKKGVLSTKKESYNNEYLELVAETQSLQKEYTDEKDKSWIEKLLS